MREGEKPTVKILDFGIAKMLQAAATTGSTRATGTPLYMAPEQTARSSNIGAHTDVWALGLIAYTCLVGKPYWEGRDVHQLFAEILMSELESPIARAGRHGVALPPDFDAWFFGCVCREPTGRYRTAGEAMTNLAYIFGLTPTSIEIPDLDLRAVAPPPVAAIAPTEMIAPATTLASQGSSQATPAAISYTPPTAPTPNGSFPPMPPMPPMPPVSPMSPGPPNVTPWQAGYQPIQSPPPAQHSSPRSGGTTASIIGAAVIVAASLIGVAFYLKPGVGKKVDKPTEVAKEKEKEKTDGKQKAADAVSPAQMKKQLAIVNPFRETAGISLHEHEVTVDEYATFLRTLAEPARKKARPLSEWTGEKVSPGAAKKPVVWVTWEQASAYCKAIDARLPTSVEWGAAVGNVYPWGDAWATKSQLEGVALGKGEGAKLVEVETSSIDRTEDGVYDLAGNVQEWTSNVEGGLATIRGGAIHMKSDEAMPAISSGASKFTEAGAGEGAKPEAIASPHLGFRCAK